MTKKEQPAKTTDRRRAWVRPGPASAAAPPKAGKEAARRPTRAAIAAAVTGFLAANAVAVRFCLLFPALLLLFWVALQRAEVNHYLTLPFATLIATLAAAILGLLHAGATLSGAVITGPGVALVVVERCSTLFEIGIFLAALLAYPARPRAKLWGALVGVGCIFLLGITRVVALYYIGRYAPRFFELAHIHVGQSLLILLIVLLWVYWVERFARARRSLTAELLRFLGKFVLFYALALVVWTLLLPGFMAALTRVSGAVWPLVSPAGVGLRLEGLELVAETREFSLRAGQVERTPFTAAPFVALVLATGGLGVGRRLRVLGIGLLILFGVYILAVLLMLEYALAAWYLSYAAQATSGPALSFAYTPAQAAVYGWLNRFYGDMGQHVLPIVLWAALVLAHTRDRAISWPRRLLG